MKINHSIQAVLAKNPNPAPALGLRTASYCTENEATPKCIDSAGAVTQHQPQPHAAAGCAAAGAGGHHVFMHSVNLQCIDQKL